MTPQVVRSLWSPLSRGARPLPLLLRAPQRALHLPSGLALLVCEVPWGAQECGVTLFGFEEIVGKATLRRCRAHTVTAVSRSAGNYIERRWASRHNITCSRTLAYISYRTTHTTEALKVRGAPLMRVRCFGVHYFPLHFVWSTRSTSDRSGEAHIEFARKPWVYRRR